MAIVINGSGTVTGLAVGGLPDGTVDAGTLATDSVTAAKIAADSVDSAELIDGAVDDSHMASIKGRKNMVSNGAMQINQRGTTATGGSTALHYGACDRWRMYQENTSAAYTLSQDSNSPDGFGSSYKVDVTTADSTLDATDRVDLLYRFEGNELQHLKKGTASAESVTLSFWVSSPKTGTHIIEFYDNDNSRAIHKAYTISAANTWEHKTILIEGDTTGAFDNDNNLSLQFSFWLMAGSNFTSGTLDTSWGSVTTANRAVGQVNVMDSTSNNFYLTGVQLEVGSTATEFEHRSYGEELALCQRYFEDLKYGGTAMSRWSGADWTGGISYSITKRVTPTITFAGPLRVWCDAAHSTGAAYSVWTGGVTGFAMRAIGGLSNKSSVFNSMNGGTITVDAEL